MLRQREDLKRDYRKYRQRLSTSVLVMMAGVSLAGIFGIKRDCQRISRYSKREVVSNQEQAPMSRGDYGLIAGSATCLIGGGLATIPYGSKKIEAESDYLRAVE